MPQPDRTGAEHSQPGQLVPSNDAQQRFVDNAKHRHNVFVLVLADELGNVADVVHRPLRVRDSHVAIEEVDRARPAGMVVPVLRSWDGMELKIDAQAVLARPLKREKHVIPGSLREEGLAGPCLDSPVGNGETNPIESCASDLGKVLLRLRDGRQGSMR